MLGPYRLLRTIGEGEFGKVKLAVHTDDTAEVAIKLIKKENIETPSRRSKLLREISILQSLDHPYIVKLIEVIETDHYIGMVMEFASGGELFEYILAHRYLKEKDACRVFAQLLAGVSFIHSVGIVHRDLKLENLLLDSNGNIIITDFGFANKSRNGDSDLLQTSCGSPCYAAPELVISDGYVGEAADIWSCGVILYAMLCGYLPYDDDPDNPDSDNINLLYKYILETELEFPDYISSDARSLLKRMLVPDPKYRAKMPEIMSHRSDSGVQRIVNSF
ncbi:kinase-like domain-containing protein [Zopfochytrium polystomum]|nr:kinase-like domain-containing protein [Zopfochytrium polystomum]